MTQGAWLGFIGLRSPLETRPWHLHRWRLCLAPASFIFFFLLQTNNKNGYVSDLNFRLALLPVLSANWPSGHSGFRGQRPQQPPKTPMTVCFSARPTVSIQSHSPPPEGRTATPEISWQQNPTWFPSPASAARVSLAGTEGGTGITTQKSHIPSLNISLCFVF